MVIVMTHNPNRSTWAEHIYRARNELLALARTAPEEEDRLALMKQYGELLAVEALIAQERRKSGTYDDDAE